MKENSVSDDSGEEGSSSSRNETRKASRAVELKSQIVSAVNFDRDLYNRILHFTPVKVTEIQVCGRGDGVLVVHLDTVSI